MTPCPRWQALIGRRVRNDAMVDIGTVTLHGSHRDLAFGECVVLAAIKQTAGFFLAILSKSGVIRWLPYITFRSITEISICTHPFFTWNVFESARSNLFRFLIWRPI